MRCVYGNVCKALDENFKRVVCTLWPKSLGAAPDSDDTVAPEWPSSGASLTAEAAGGRVLLRWKPATDNEGMYGYEVLRSEGAGILLHYASIRAASLRFEDTRVVAGVTYRTRCALTTSPATEARSRRRSQVCVPNDFAPSNGRTDASACVGVRS